jgi:hypothetical protein
MKRQISAVACVLAVLVWTCTPVSAEFAGRLKKNQPWTLEVTAASANEEATAVTVVYVNSNGMQDVIDSLSVPAPEPMTTSFIRLAYSRIPRGTRRIIIQLSFPSIGGGSVRVRQGDVQFETDLADDETLVWDVVDVP